jgi:hypothetical protein
MTPTKKVLKALKYSVALVRGIEGRTRLNRISRAPSGRLTLYFQLLTAAKHRGNSIRRRVEWMPWHQVTLWDHEAEGRRSWAGGPRCGRKRIR